MKKNSIGGRSLIGLCFLFLYLPIFLLIIFSFNKGDSSAVWRGFSLKWYVELFHNRLVIEGLATTLLVSLLATAISTVAGTFAAIGIYNLTKKWRGPILVVNDLPMMNADIVTGVSLCLFFVAFFNGWHGIASWINAHQTLFTLPTRLHLGLSTLLIAHVCFDIPYVILNVAPRLRQMDSNLVEAAQDLGCTWMQAFVKVILPEIKPGIVSGALIAFTMSVDDFVISYFTAGSATQTLAMVIYGMTKKRVTPVVNAVSTLMFLAVLIVLIINNVRSAKMAKLAAKRASFEPVPESPRLRRFREWMATPRGKLARRVTAGVLCAAFVATTVFLTAFTTSRPVVNVCSWGEYIDEDLITEFEEQTGIRVNYQTAESNEALYSLLSNGGADYDVVVPSDYMISQLIEEDMLQPLDYSQIPNFSLISNRFKNLPYDPENKYTVPYTWGTVGIIYNSAMIEDEIDSWSCLYDDKYAGQVLLIGNSRDAFGIALKYLGYSMNTTDPDEIREAYDLVRDAYERGVFQGKVMDEVFQTMEGGNAAFATYYAGDYLSMLENNEDLRFVVPKEGSNWFVDAMCVLKDCPNYDNAMKWINFIASTDSNLRNMDYIWYASPNEEALELYPEWYEEQYGEPLDPEIYSIMAAPQEVLDRCEMYICLPKPTRALYNELWIKLGI